MFIFARKDNPMRTSKFEKEINDLLSQKRVLTVQDFLPIYANAPKSSVYSCIRALRLSGKLSQLGRGLYQAVHKPGFKVPITDWMREVNDFLIDNCVGITHSLIQRDDNLYVEASRKDAAVIYDSLRNKYGKVVREKDAARFPAKLNGYIIVGTLVSEAPLSRTRQMQIPTLEKLLVDDLCNKHIERKCLLNQLQKAMEVFPVNENRLRRYAARRGVAELSCYMRLLDKERIRMFADIQSYLSGIPVKRAWVFGSFARCEETPESDLDLLIDYDNSNLSLLQIIRYKLDLEKMIGREVDLIQTGSLKPFAIPSAERDKYLIYER